MADALIRNVDDGDPGRTDTLAAEQGLPRSELSQVTLADLEQIAELAKGVLDKELMRRAWE